ncbi:hypothetical protein ACCO45_010888 [Purpureocillium lilacinum]|uniref:Uncharacterized protein n=1 Tax=Purpureocillium lilacinum TaxID=33203 RepID=A0ACC4DJ46_PURLI
MPQPQRPQGVPFDSERMELNPDLLEGWTRQATGAPESDFGTARWHQNFDGWDLVGGIPNNSVFMFGDQNRSNSLQNPSEPTDQSRAGFEGLAASLNGGGWLTGLD